MKLKTARRVLSRNSWIASRSIVECGKIKPASLSKRINQAGKLLAKAKKKKEK